MSDYDAVSLHTGTLPVLPVPDVAETIDFYVNTLGFDKLFDVPIEDGTVVTGQVAKQGNNIMFNLNPGDATSRGGGIYLWCRVEEIEIDAYCAELTNAGLEIVDELQDQFWGDRYFAVRDNNGYVLAFNKSKAH